MAKLTLVEARGLLGWTQGRLASESGVRVTAISDIETRRTENPGYATVVRIIKALKRGGLQGLEAEDIFQVPDAPATVTGNDASRGAR